MSQEAEAKTTKTRKPRNSGPLAGPMKGMLRPSEVAPILGVSESALASWRTAGTKLRYFKVGSTIGYKKEDVEACRKEFFELKEFAPTEK